MTSGPQLTNSLLRRPGPPPREGGFLFWRFHSCPLSQKPVQKWFLPPKKGVAFLTEDVFEKKFQVREKIPLSALAPAHMAAPLLGEAARGLTGSVTRRFRTIQVSPKDLPRGRW
jgi:hypothetical protein